MFLGANCEKVLDTNVQFQSKRAEGSIIYYDILVIYLCRYRMYHHRRPDMAIQEK
jgi:hypothetical protein